MSDNKTEIRREIDGWFEKHSGEMINDLRRLVAVKSVRSPAQAGAPYGPNSREVLALAGSMLEAKGFKVDCFEDIVITATLGSDPPLMGILAHLDIVEAGEGWDTDPFAMAEKDGKLFGRGVIDNKGPAVAAMYALCCVRDIFPELGKGVQVIFGSGEETGFDDITRYLAKNEPPPYVFTPDGEFPVVNIEKGRFAPFFGASWRRDSSLPRIVSANGGKTMNIVPNRAEAVIEGMEACEAEVFCREFSEKTGAAISVRADGNRLVITSEGKAAHAARPHLGLNAQTALIEMLAAMPFAESAGFGYICALSRLFPHGDNQGKALGIAMEDETGDLTVNFGVLRFSEIEFSGNFDSRTPACADDVDIHGITESSFDREGIKLTSHTRSKCHHTPEDSPFVQALLRIYEDYTGEPGYCLSIGGQTYVHDITGGVVFGAAMPGVENNVHGANEFIELDQLILGSKMCAQAIIDMCSKKD